MLTRPPSSQPVIQHDLAPFLALPPDPCSFLDVVFSCYVPQHLRHCISTSSQLFSAFPGLCPSSSHVSTSESDLLPQPLPVCITPPVPAIHHSFPTMLCATPTTKVFYLHIGATMTILTLHHNTSHTVTMANTCHPFTTAAPPSPTTAALTYVTTAAHTLPRDTHGRQASPPFSPPHTTPAFRRTQPSNSEPLASHSPDSRL